MSANHARAALVQTLLDFLSVFRKSLGKLPSSPEVLKAQRSVTVLTRALEELEDTLK